MNEQILNYYRNHQLTIVEVTTDYVNPANLLADPTQPDNYVENIPEVTLKLFDADGNLLAEGDSNDIIIALQDLVKNQ